MQLLKSKLLQLLSLNTNFTLSKEFILLIEKKVVVVDEGGVLVHLFDTISKWCDCVGACLSVFTYHSGEGLKFHTQTALIDLDLNG